jgi:hypothetical protein
MPTGQSDGVEWSAHGDALDERPGAYFVPGHRAQLIQHWIPRPLGNHAGPEQLQAVAAAGGFNSWRLAYSSPVSTVHDARTD